MQSSIIDPLKSLQGTWRGNGTGGFPTLEDFSFYDEMTFRFLTEAYDQEPLIHFEEIAWITDGEEKKFMHWEAGYFKPSVDGGVQFYVSHNTGRIEMLYGQINLSDTGFSLQMDSEFLRNDVGLKEARSSRREFVLHEGRLCYCLEMSTVDVESLTEHLRIDLNRSN